MPTAPSEPILVGPITVTFSVEAEQSNGTVTVFRCDVADGAGMPIAHSHDAFEETLYGIAGVTTLVVDGETIQLGEGDTCCIPRGAVHAFSADAGDVSFLAIATPGVFGPDYFREFAAVLAAGGPPDPDAVMAVMLRHGLTPAMPAA